MSKSAVATVSSCRMHRGWIGVALSALALLPATLALGATPDPILRRSEQLDARRLGKVSTDERSLLRVEWRAAVSGAEEARTVQGMLDSLRRMEETVAEIHRLIRAIPEPKPAVAAVAAEPAESAGYDMRLIAANITAVCLVALWWLRRRNPARQAAPPTAANTAPDASPPLAAGGEPPEARQMPAREAAGERRGETPQLGPGAAPAAAKTAPAPPPAAESHVIDFMLEDADPEVVARENARAQKLQALNRRKAPERQKQSNVEPTLELAGIMLSLGLEQGAAQALVEYTEANPRQALHHWLKLLDIYRGSGNQEEFKEAAEKLRRNFNIQAENWAKAGSAEAPTLENFPRVAEQVQQAWRRPTECIAYLRHLLEDNREGERTGFPRPVAEEILLLIDILKDGQTSAA